MMLRTTSAIAVSLALGAAAPGFAKVVAEAVDADAPAAQPAPGTAGEAAPEAAPDGAPETAADPGEAPEAEPEIDAAEDEGPTPQIEGGEWHVNLDVSDGLVQMVPLSVAEQVCGPEVAAGAGPGDVLDCPEVAMDDPELEAFQ